MPQDSILKPNSLRDQVFGIVKSRVILGILQPGEIYSATAIAQELQVSSSPVREAMLSLVDLGLMEPVRNRGFRVKALDEAARNEIVAIRIMLEVPAMVQLCAQPAAIRALAPALSGFIDTIEQAARDEDLIAYLAADRQFHLMLLGLLGNQRLLDLVNQLRDQTLLVGLSKLYASGELRAEAESHRQILTAMLAGDALSVERLMLAHMRANTAPEPAETLAK